MTFRKQSSSGKWSGEFGEQKQLKVSGSSVGSARVMARKAAPDKNTGRQASGTPTMIPSVKQTKKLKKAIPEVDLKNIRQSLSPFS